MGAVGGALRFFSDKILKQEKKRFSDKGFLSFFHFWRNIREYSMPSRCSNIFFQVFMILVFPKQYYSLYKIIELVFKFNCHYKSATYRINVCIWFSAVCDYFNTIIGSA